MAEIILDKINYTYSDGTAYEIQALKDVNLQIHQGEFIGIIGHTGSGKSTLTQLLNGLLRASSGSIYVDGQDIYDEGYDMKALRSKVGLVFQYPDHQLFETTCFEDVCFGPKNQGLDRKDIELRAFEALRNVGFPEELFYQPPFDLSGGQKRRVAIAGVLAMKPDVLILDEPTSSLTFNEVQSLFKTVEDLKKKGIAIIYITHRLTEVFEIATHVAIMRDGVITLEGPVGNFTKEMLIQGLLPNDAQGAQQTEKAYVPVDYAHLKPVMQVKDFSGYGFSNITFDLYPGEILGIAGVVGAGRTELISTIFGRDKTLGGKVILDGRDITGLPTKKVLEAGINFVPEDRHYHGIFKIRSISSNTTSALLNGKDVGAVNMDRRRQGEIAQKYVKDFRTKIVSLEDQIGSLSGGNQQKVVIARALSTKPKVVILDEPTRGIDAAARGDVYNIIRQLKDAGVAVLMVSSDMEEVVELADRAVTVFQGRINGEFSREEITQDALTSASFGIAHERKV